MSLNQYETDLSVRHKAMNDALYQKLLANLNGPWKRIQADEFDEANKDFYENIFNREFLDHLSKITGDYYPDWGINHQGNLIGGRNKDTGLYVPVGIRWTISFDDWRSGKAKGAASKKVRTIDKKIVRPQIVVTMRPLATYLDFKKKYSKSKNPSKYSAEERPLDEKRCRRDPRFKEVQIIPLYVYIQRYPKDASLIEGESNYEERRFNVMPSEKSCHHKEIMPRTQEQRNADEELSRKLIELGNQIAKDWK